MADIDGIVRLKAISVEENRLFHTSADVMNSCFGKSWRGNQRGWIPLNDGSGFVVWFPKMAKKRRGKLVPYDSKRGWCNELSDDGTVLIERHQNDSRPSISDDEKLQRYVFGRYEDNPYRNGKVQTGEKGGYRFLGIFQIDLEKSGRGYRVSRRISNKADLRLYAGISSFEMPKPAVIKANEAEDDCLVSNLKHGNLSGQKDGFKYAGMPQEVKESIVKDGIKIYPRDKQRALNALSHAHFACEIDPEHPTFIRKHSERTYTEPHHLIPLAMQDLFDVSLDVEENIVSLCSNCHNEIHYGRDANKLIRKLYAVRREALTAAGIEVEVDSLLKMYGY